MNRPLAAIRGATVSLEGVSKRYGHATVLDNVDLEIPAGSFCTFLGPSGSGKTTTLNIVGGLLSPDGGRILIDGDDATRRPPDKRELGFVFQSYALFPHMTVARNIGYPLKLRGLDAAERDRRVREVLELVHLSHIAERYPSQLSGGQQQRVALARAVVFGPRALLMDEPLSALDAGLRAHLQREIVRIAKDVGCTVLYVTHDQEEALAMSDQIVLFNKGAIEQKGTPRELYTYPQTAFSSTFVGHGRLLPGTVDFRNGGPAIVFENGWLPVNPDASPPSALVAGTKAAAVFRPETAYVSAPEKEPGEDGSGFIFAKGTVTGTVFAGGQTRVFVEIAPELEFECRISNAAEPVSTGQSVSLGVSLASLPAAVPLPAG